MKRSPGQDSSRPRYRARPPPSSSDEFPNGTSSKLRGFFEEHAIGYVFAVGTNFQVPTGVGPMRADLLTARKIPKRAWNRPSCGQGAKGPRVYDWALIATASPRHHLLVRRSLADPTDLAFFYAYVPPGRSMALADLVKIAGIRWAVEEDFANGKDAVGLDHTQARRYRPGADTSCSRWPPSPCSP
ncbi:hypothetical protein [Streptomyces sp. bgisy027]|uniref:hypothetical protein n=1 Tax=Streptomyces sp. bgisy027 TaxID=3413770 RepID=UPI003D716B38